MFYYPKKISANEKVNRLINSIRKMLISQRLRIIACMKIEEQFAVNTKDKKTSIYIYIRLSYSLRAAMRRGTREGRLL